jgi:hypothetical protein
MEKLQQDFLELDVGSLCEIFRLKSEQEEVSDFSFSFGQTDICEGLVSWVSHDLDNRQEWGIDLSVFISFVITLTLSTRILL